jgi:hypothetical protein
VSSLSDKIVGLLGDIEQSVSGGGSSVSQTIARPAPQQAVSQPSYSSGSAGSADEWEDF